MATPKAADLLNASDSEDDRANSYDSEDDMRKGGRGAKRRKISSDDELESDDERDDRRDADDDNGASDAESREVRSNKPGPDSKAKAKSKADSLPKVDRPITKKNLVATEAAIKKSGVVYMSRVPPFMKPNKLRSLLAPYGEINRIFLAPEDPVARARRVKGGGNKRKTFTEGWVEFLEKKRAKAVCELLNARPIGGKKGSYYRDDIWNLLYLKGFKWHNLTEQIAAEDAERSSRMRAEISKSTRENKLFVRNVERGKMLQGMEAKTKKRKASQALKKDNNNDDDNGDGDGDDGDDGRSGGAKKEARTFRQVAQVKRDQDTSEQPEHVTRILSKIF
ncbi:Pre-rRNA-processing protein ESF2 [Escovopsis weberi]|uniref:18S rRNA factor 2 n=1 Tax=Escovopsis weberi TaxID=150374 RepID=A0A0N0RT57_ESCWE|nr:Pre-rRNA-processing protein ESF2 [Escovopsis weberi]